MTQRKSNFRCPLINGTNGINGLVPNYICGQVRPHSPRGEAAAGGQEHRPDIPTCGQGKLTATYSCSEEVGRNQGCRADIILLRLRHHFFPSLESTPTSSLILETDHLIY